MYAGGVLRSTDGGLTWSAPVPIAMLPDASLCEPGVLRSPDGKQIAFNGYSRGARKVSVNTCRACRLLARRHDIERP